MFSFYRQRSEPVEIWSILLAQNSVQDAEKHFGKPISYNRQTDLWHEVGELVVIPTGVKYEFFLTCKDGLTDDEKIKLLREMELLMGNDCYENGSEEKCGWFLHDTLKLSF